MRAPLSSRRRFFRTAAGTTAFLLLAGEKLPTRVYAATVKMVHVRRYFTDTEYRFLEAACDCIYPHDTFGPGATELGVPEFIDRQMDSTYGRGELWYLSGPVQDGPANLGYQLALAPRDIYRHGIASADSFVTAQHGRVFAALSRKDQIAVLSAFESGAIHFPDMNARIFFEQLRANTLEGVFSDPVHGGNRGMEGWRLLAFPGARADFMDWVNQEGAPYPFGPISLSSQIG